MSISSDGCLKCGRTQDSGPCPQSNSTDAAHVFIEVGYPGPETIATGEAPAATPEPGDDVFYTKPLTTARNAKAGCSRCGEAWTLAIAEMERMTIALYAEPTPNSETEEGGETDGT